ncbi:MAG: PIG-L family deacetylase [Myxococcaceae bacterium]|nr:PIG-L family deacetylase [Myxococcaceae bacterium]
MRWSLLLTVLSACPHSARGPAPAHDLLVIAPHPDDEVLMAAGLLRRALAEHRRVAVVVVTNGDFTCARDGRARQAETVAALGSLGLRESDVHFLGYPDGHLHELTATTLSVARTAGDGGCVASSSTWANRGAGHVDEHTWRTGHPGTLTSDGLVEDLAALFSALRPRDLVVPHAIDTHRDHAMTYVFVRRALDRAGLAPRLHRSVIHASEPCWPGSCGAPRRLDLEQPPLPPPLEGYEADERLPIDADAKLATIGFYRSQLDQPLDTDWLASFARRDERFFTERCERRAARVICAPPNASLGCDGASCVARRADGYDETSTWRGQDFISLVIGARRPSPERTATPAAAPP